MKISDIEIYKDDRLPKGTALVGYKAKDITDTGFVYAPYIPAVLSPVDWEVDPYFEYRLSDTWIDPVDPTEEPQRDVVFVPEVPRDGIVKISIEDLMNKKYDLITRQEIK